MTPERIAFLGPELSKVATDISHRLGWRSPDQGNRGHSEFNDVFSD
jgi:hypothetical protein